MICTSWLASATQTVVQLLAHARPMQLGLKTSKPKRSAMLLVAWPPPRQVASQELDTVAGLRVLPAEPGEREWAFRQMALRRPTHTRNQKGCPGQAIEHANHQSGTSEVRAAHCHETCKLRLTFA
jgi:hypothetical protein